MSGYVRHPAEPAESTPHGPGKKAQAAGIPDSLGEVRLVVEGGSTKILAQKRALHIGHKWDRAVSGLGAELKQKLWFWEARLHEAKRR
jgi:hypothetical protein